MRRTFEQPPLLVISSAPDGARCFVCFSSSAADEDHGEEQPQSNGRCIIEFKHSVLRELPLNLLGFWVKPLSRGCAISISIAYIY